MPRPRAVARNFAATIRPVTELVLIASDIYRAASDVPHPHRAVPLPCLSRIARYGTVEPLTAGWRTWVTASLGHAELASAEPASIASAAAMQSGAPYLWLADPVHLIIGPTSVHLPANGRLALDADTQQRLARAFSETFAPSGYRLEPLRGGGFLASGPAPAGEVQTIEPARALGTRIADALPRGRGAGALRALGAEIEMWLHEHPLNAQRAREHRPPVSTLWFWGGGPPLEAAREPDTPSESPGVAIFGDDSYMEGLARLCAARFEAAPADLGAIPVPAPATGTASRRLVALELLRSDELEPLAALERFERDWVAPALEQLKQGRLARVTVLANDRRLSIGPHDAFRFWRRPRPALAVLR